MANTTATLEPCAICYCDLSLTDKIALTVCSHTFCLTCLLTWRAENGTCPLCRDEIWRLYEIYVTPGGRIGSKARDYRPKQLTMEFVNQMREGHNRCVEWRLKHQRELFALLDPEERRQHLDCETLLALKTEARSLHRRIMIDNFARRQRIDREDGMERVPPGTPLPERRREDDLAASRRASQRQGLAGSRWAPKPPLGGLAESRWAS